MKPSIPVRLLAGAVCTACTGAHAGDLWDEWQITGSNTLRLESYRVKGDPLSGPYRYEGGQYFDEFNFNLTRSLSPYDTLRAQIFGVANDSYYRSPDHGFVPERLNLTREKGDAAIPYRLEAGDSFAYFSYRTLQRPLKGGQIELQPLPGPSGWRHSLVFVSGADQPNWQHVPGSDNWTSGASWLVEADPQKRFSLNLVHNARQGNPTLGTLDRSQTVASATGEYVWQWGAQRLRLETELAGLRGDHDGYLDTAGLLVPQNGQSRNGSGAFAQLSGQSNAAPLDYRLRYERYDRDFRPANSVVPNDRQSEELHLGWRFADGASVRGRIQHFIDALQSGNALRTQTVGVNWTGPLFAGSIDRLGGSLDAFRQGIAKDDSSVDRAVWNLSAALTKPLPDAWAGNLNLQLQQVNDRVPGANDTRNAQLQLGATHAIAAGGWNGTFTPGLTLHRLHGDPNAGMRDWSPALAFTLARVPHAISANYGYQKLQPDAASAATVQVNALRADYRYSAGQHTFGIEASAYDRRVTVGQYNDSYRVSAFWTYAFDKPPRRAAAAAPAPAQADSAAPLARSLSLLQQIVPGSDFGAIDKRMAASGMPAGASFGNVAVYEQRLIDDLTERQRVALVRDDGRITAVALVITPNDPNNAQDVAQAYERVRKAMLDRFGRPDFTFEEGALGPTFVADLNAGRLARVMEWRTEAGKLRLGIPRRLDGQVRIEVQHAAGFGSPRDGVWSIEGVR